MTRVRRAVAAAADRFATAGIDSARVDAELLAAHVAGVDRGRLFITEPDDDFESRFRDVVDARVRRVPLQHLVGSAAFGPVTLSVGPGVFVPRPETEALLEWALAQPLPRAPVIVDLCTGSGALAVALSHALPAATVVAVEDSPGALEYARRNVADVHVDLVAADVTADGLLSEYDGAVDLLVANPPYIPEGADLDPEVAEHDPARALFGGPDGMSVIRPLVVHAARLLRRGSGRIGIEHDDTTAAATVAVFERTGAFYDVTSRRDLTGRPRFVTALRAE
ncbi:peptide chain release factor N(5)-glutamine methyltransferase [Mycolicibacterium sediminis]|uniref:Release factor glutamine methyltransferase n=1 Tax=Mycolicibacterium sediminis TaxID=1286180 RepID=A0A7I7QXP5_9MYCO|nr:peptide chain release factor N(5)-glutamine methyltransferase [Mycolicibacterium sediminis]BBY31111.1 release factor glutamine methyltransferase [Mycolicibacterium sediminis]